MGFRLGNAHLAHKQPEKCRHLDREDRRPPDHHVEEDENAECEGATLLRRGLPCRIKTDEQPEGHKPEHGAGIDHIDIAAIGKACDIARIERQQLDEVEAEKALHGEHDPSIERVAARIRTHQVDQGPGDDDRRHDQRPDAVGGLRKQEIAEEADEREGQHAARIIGQQDEGDRDEDQHAVESRDLAEAADEIDAQHAGEIGKRDLFEKQGRSPVVAEPEREPPGNIDRVLKDLRPAERDLLQTPRIGEIERRIEQVLIEAGEEDLDQQNRENEEAAHPEYKCETATVGRHAELAENRDDQHVAEKIHEQHAIGGRGIEHDQRKEADQRNNRQRLLRKTAIEQIEQCDEEERDLDKRDMGKAERHHMCIDDREKAIVHHRQGHHDAHEPTVLPDGLGYRPRLRIVKGADIHGPEVTDSRHGEKWNAELASRLTAPL